MLFDLRILLPDVRLLEPKQGICSPSGVKQSLGLVPVTIPAMSISESQPGETARICPSDTGTDQLRAWTGMIFDCKRTSHSGLLTLEYINVDAWCNKYHIQLSSAQSWLWQVPE